MTAVVFLFSSAIKRGLLIELIISFHNVVINDLGITNI
jgi:hypothetical protein